MYTYSRRTGAGLGGDMKESYQGDFFVRLIDAGKRPPIWTVMDDLNNKITSQVPGIQFDTHELLDDMIGDMVGRRQPVVIQLTARNPGRARRHRRESRRRDRQGARACSRRRSTTA